MADSTPPPAAKKNGKKALDWAALITAIIGALGALTAYMRAKSEPEAKGAYEALVVQVIKQQEAATQNRDDLEKLRAYVIEHDKQQEERIKEFADAFGAAMTPPASAPSAQPHVTNAVRRAKTAAMAPTAAPPPLAPAPVKRDRVQLDKDFKKAAAEAAPAF